MTHGTSAHETSLHANHPSDLQGRRQEAMAVLAEGDAAEIEQLLARCARLPAHPVSYTHLDVYKRQLHHGPLAHPEIRQSQDCLLYTSRCV